MEHTDQLPRRFASRLMTELALGRPVDAAEWEQHAPAGLRPARPDLERAAHVPSAVLLGPGHEAAGVAVDGLLSQAHRSVESAVCGPEQLRVVPSRRGEGTIRGVRHRCLVDERRLRQTSALRGHDAQTEYRVGAVDVWMLVLDRRAVVIDGPAVGAGLRGTWLVTYPEVLRAATGLFEARWRQARHWEHDPGGPRDDDLSPRQQRVAALLLRGHCEQAIGRELDISRRTVAYEITAMMRALGASGRVDLGYRLRLREESAGD